MSPETLESIAQQLTTLNQFFLHQSNSKTVLDFPEDFEVTSDDGYSLGKFVCSNETGLWVFLAYETQI